MQELLTTIYQDWMKPGIYLYFIFWCIPYLVRKGWNDAENNTKKVCDTCFRDIKKWNEEVRKVREENKL